MGFVSDVSRVFVVAVSHGLGPNLAAVRGFRRRYSKARFRDAFEASFVGDMSAPGSVRQGFPCWGQSFPFIHFSFFFIGFVSNVSRVFVVAVSHGLGPNLAAVRGFRRRYSKARFRDAFEASFVGDMSAPGSVRKGFRKGVPCWSQSFPFIFLFNGFRKRRFESFCGGGFAWLGPESCCCSRLFEAFAGGTPRSDFETLLRHKLCRRYVGSWKRAPRFSLLEPIFSFLFSFFLMGFVSDVSGVFVVAVSHGLGPNLAAVRGFRRRYSKARFRDAFEASFVGDMSAPGSVRQGFRKGVPGWSQSFRFIFLSF